MSYYENIELSLLSIVQVVKASVCFHNFLIMSKEVDNDDDFH